MTKLLLVSHEASLTGAPRVAINLLDSAVRLVDTRDVLVRWPGPLGQELARSADRFRLEPLRRTRVLLRRFRRTRHLAVRLESGVARLVLALEKPDVVYLNTVKSACYVRPALDRGCRVILHSHELGSLASETLSRYRLEGLYKEVCLVACSNAARACLQEITGADDILVLPSSVDPQRVQLLATDESAEMSILVSCLSRANGLVVACGTADHRKGTDLWLQMVGHVKSLRGDACPLFVWIGQDVGGFRETADRLGVGDRVQFVGETSNPYPMIAAADVVTVTSREDASPLYVLEAMSLGKPIVAFDIQGIRDQIADAGVLVRADDPTAMADVVARLVESLEEREALGERASQRVREEFGITSFNKSVEALITRVLSGAE